MYQITDENEKIKIKSVTLMLKTRKYGCWRDTLTKIKMTLIKMGGRGTLGGCDGHRTPNSLFADFEICHLHCGYL